MVGGCNPNTLEAETGGWRLQGQHELRSNTPVKPTNQTSIVEKSHEKPFTHIFPPTVKAQEGWSFVALWPFERDSVWRSQWQGEAYLLAFGPGEELGQREADIWKRYSSWLSPVKTGFETLQPWPNPHWSQLRSVPLVSLLKQPGCKPTHLMAKSFSSVSTNKLQRPTTSGPSMDPIKAQWLGSNYGLRWGEHWTITGVITGSVIACSLSMHDALG